MLTITGPEEEVRLHLAVCELIAFNSTFIETLPNDARKQCACGYSGIKITVNICPECEAARCAILPDNKGAGPLGLLDQLNLSSGKAVDAPNVVSDRRRKQRERI